MTDFPIGTRVRVQFEGFIHGSNDVDYDIDLGDGSRLYALVPIKWNAVTAVQPEPGKGDVWRKPDGSLWFIRLDFAPGYNLYAAGARMGSVHRLGDIPGFFDDAECVFSEGVKK